MENVGRFGHNARGESQQEKVWFITGASSGLGLALTKHLLEQGAYVAASARKPDELKGLEAYYPGNLQRLKMDVTDGPQIEQAIASALARFGRIDVLVNNAGYGVTGAVEEVSLDEYMPMFDTNFFGLVSVTKALLPQFRKQMQGSIVNLSSIGGLIGSAGWGYYNATKFAVEGLSEALAAELAPLGIHVMVVEPGPFRTDFLGRSGVEAHQRIPDYEPSAGKAREYFATQSGKQAGDPAACRAEAIVEAVSSPEPPKHLLLGKIALQRYRARLEQWTADLDRWQRTTVESDYPSAQ